MLIRLSNVSHYVSKPISISPKMPPRAKRRGECTYHYIILILRIDRLIVRRYVNLIVGQLVFAEVFKEICVSWTVEVNIGI
jgi:hypothetical protein